MNYTKYAKEKLAYKNFIEIKEKKIFHNHNNNIISKKLKLIKEEKNKMSNEKTCISKQSIIFTNQMNAKQNKNNNLNFNNNILEKCFSDDKKNINKQFCPNINNDFRIILKNVGNTTYMNSALRCLSNNYNFSSYYLKNKDVLNNNKQDIPISYAFSRIIYHLYPEKDKPFHHSYSLDKFHKTIMQLNPIFRGKSTKNAIDFLIYLIERLHEENKLLKKILKNSGKTEPIEIDYNNNNDKYMKLLNEIKDSKVYGEFCWINKSVEKCWSCGNEKMTFNSFFTYDLDFENALRKTILNYNKELTILNCIKYSLETENLYNVFCEKCDMMTNIEKKSSIQLCGNSLIFLFRGIEKIENINNIKNNGIKLKIEEKLNLSNLIGISNYIYALNGLISYNIEESEYIAYSIDPFNRKWYKYIKEDIIAVELNDFINEYELKIFPVILFYRRI
jgi:ubiquitin C-terminal hydrolase